MKQKIKGWDDITVGQFIDLQQLSQQKNSEEVQTAERAIAIIFNMTERQVEELPIPEFRQYAKLATSIMTSKIEGKAKKIIKGEKNKYEIIYDPKKLVQRQFVEIQYFMQDVNSNLHYILASIVKLVKPFGRREKNTADNHEQFANDLLGAKITDVYHSCVFFCKLYLNSLIHIHPYLVSEMMKKGATQKQANELMRTSIDAMAGLITQKDWLILKV